MAGDFRVRVEAEFTVPKKKNAETTKDKVVDMIKGSGFEEKDFIISIDRTELVENSLPVPIVVEEKIKAPRRHYTKRKVDKKKPRLITNVRRKRNKTK